MLKRTDMSMDSSLGEKSKELKHNKLAENGGQKEQLETVAEKAREVVDLLMESYVNKDNILRRYNQLYAPSTKDAPDDINPIINQKIKSIWREAVGDDYWDEFDSIVDLEKIPGFIEELKKRFSDKTQNLKDRIIIAQIFSDISYEIIVDDDLGGVGFLEELRTAREDKNNPLFYQAFLNIEAGRSESAKRFLRDGDSGDQEDKEEKDVRLQEGCFYNYHENKFDSFQLKLTSEMAININEGRGDERNYGEFHPIRKEDGRDSYGAPEFDYLGDYLVTKLAPNRHGVYARDGVLIGVLKSIPEIASDKIDVENFEKVTAQINFENPTEDIFLFKLMASLPFRNEIKKRLGFDIAELDLKNQYYFLQFIGSRSEGDFARVREFISQGKTEKTQMNRVKTFLSLEFGEDLSENMFAISENIEPEQADLIFAKYAEIADLAYEAEREVLGLVKDSEKSKKIDPRKISLDLLKRGKDILAMFAEKVRRAKGKEEEIPAEEILSDLADYQQDLVFHAAGVREGKKNGLKYEDFVGAQFKVLTAREVSENEKLALQMRLMQEKNWKHENPQFQESLAEGLDEKIREGGEDVLFFVFEQNNKLTSFCRIDKSGYFGSLNTKPSMKGSALGWGVSEAAFETWGKDLEAHSDPFDSRATPIYIEKDGFVAIGTEEYAGKYSVHILREKKPKDYFFREKSQAEIINYHLDHNSGNNYGKEDAFAVLALPVGSDEMRTILNEFLNDNHFVLTRYFFDKEGKTAYCGLERGSSSS
ncbi:MAG: hypothetical protein WAV73_04635 [Candidatus Moraniibacteriota bacterium]